MAYYAYKQVRDKLIKAGLLNKYASPVDKEKYGDDLKLGYDGNIHDIASDYIEKLEQENAELRAAVEGLKAELSDAATQYKCGCGHPHCNNCKRDTEYAEALNKTPSQHLNDVKAEAVEYTAKALRSDKYLFAADVVEQYAQQLRGG